MASRGSLVAEPDHPLQGHGRRMGGGPQPAGARRRDAGADGPAQRLEGAAGRSAAGAAATAAAAHSGRDRTMSDETKRAHGAAARKPAKRRPHRRDRRAGARSSPASLWYFVVGPPDALHVAGPRAGLRGAGGGRSVGPGAEGARQEQRQRGTRTAAASTIDPTQYRIALQRSRSDYESVAALGQRIGGVGGRSAGRRCAAADGQPCPRPAGCARRLEQIFAEDPGAISMPPGPERAGQPRSRRAARSRPPEADLHSRPGGRGRQRRQERATDQRARGVEKAELDLQRTEVVAPARRPGDRPAHRRRAVRAGRRAGR